MGEPGTSEDGVVVATARWEPLVAGGFCVALVTGTGWLLQAVARLLSAVTAGPVAGAFDTVADLPWPVFAFWTGLGIGLLCFGGLTADRQRVAITPRRIVFGRRGRGPVFDRNGIGAVYLDGTFLVVDGPTGERLGRERVDASRLQTLQQALTRYEYPWSDGPPRAPEGPWST
jgi:hypothetical protein